MAVAAMTTGMASGAGGAVVEEVRDLVRGRLAGTEEGRGALARLDAEPGADDAAQAVQARLVVALEGDPELSRRLWAALQPVAPPPPAPAPVTHQSIAIGGDANRANIVIGPLHLRRTGGVVITLIAVGLVLAVLLVLGFRSVLNGLTDEADGSSSSPKVAALKDAAQVGAVLPGSGSVPAHWQTTQDADVSEGAPDDCSSACEGALFTGTVRYESPGEGTGAFFYVQAYDNADHAARRFTDLRTDYDARTDSFQPMSLQPLGDESAAYRHTMVNAERAEAGVLVGTVVTWVTYRAQDDALDSSDLTALARMLTDRARQAQNGSTPTARADI